MLFRSIGKTLADARAALKEFNYVINDADVTYEYNDTVAEGLIFVAEKLTEPVMSDDGTTVTTQGTIRVVISKGADRFKDFRGMTQADAKAALATAKYTAGSVEYTGYEVTSVVMQSSDVVNADEVMDYKLVAEAWTEPAVEGQLKPEYEPGYTDPATGLPLPRSEEHTSELQSP